MTRNALEEIYLSHYEISADDDFPNAFPVPRNIFKVFALCLINNPYTVRSGITISLPSHAFCTLFQRKCQP